MLVVNQVRFLFIIFLNPPADGEVSFLYLGVILQVSLYFIDLLYHD